MATLHLPVAIARPNNDHTCSNPTAVVSKPDTATFNSLFSFRILSKSMTCERSIVLSLTKPGVWGVWEQWGMSIVVRIVRRCLKTNAVKR
jgi:hypothetical protein